MSCFTVKLSQIGRMDFYRHGSSPEGKRSVAIATREFRWAFQRNGIKPHSWRSYAESQVIGLMTQRHRIDRGQDAGPILDFVSQLVS